LPVPAAILKDVGSSAKKLQLSIRPENIEFSQEEKAGYAPFKVSVTENMGDHQILTMQTKKTTIKGRTVSQMHVTQGQTIWMAFPEHGTKIYENDRLIWFHGKERSARK